MRRQKIASLNESFEAIRADYNAARSSRYRRRRQGISLAGSGADYHYKSDADYLRIMESARDMDRNDMVVGQMIDRAVTNVVQTGVTLDITTGDEKLDNDLWARWQDWAETPEQCDLAGEASFYEQEAMVLRSMLVDGDTVALGTREGALQTIEAHRIRTPKNTSKNVVHGVLLDENRRRIQYWITKDDIDPSRALTKVSDTVPVDTRDADGNRQVFHVYNPKRMSQTRGVSALAPVFDGLGMFEDINFAKMVQQQVVSCFAVFRERELGYEGGAPGQRGERETDTLSDGSTRTIEGIAPGMEIFGQPGEKLTGFSPAVPNAEFFQHVELILTLVSVNLGLPLMLVLLTPKGTFSSYRGAIDQARLGFRRNQKCLIKRFHTPVYQWKVRQWASEDAALRNAAKRSGINIFGHRWSPPRFDYIEPSKDAAADGIKLEKLLTSPRRLHNERGADYEEIFTETIVDNGRAIRAAIKEAQAIQKETAVEVDWHELLHIGAEAPLAKVVADKQIAEETAAANDAAE